MYKLSFILLTLMFLNGCAGQTASVISSGAAIASGSSVARTISTTGTNLYIEQKTGKSTLDHVADKTVNYELRECDIYHSADLNKIFFVTLDRFDCELK